MSLLCRIWAKLASTGLVFVVNLKVKVSAAPGGLPRGSSLRSSVFLRPADIGKGAILAGVVEKGTLLSSPLDDFGFVTNLERQTSNLQARTNDERRPTRTSDDTQRRRMTLDHKRRPTATQAPAKPAHQKPTSVSARTSGISERCSGCPAEHGFREKVWPKLRQFWSNLDQFWQDRAEFGRSRPNSIDVKPSLWQN